MWRGIRRLSVFVLVIALAACVVEPAAAPGVSPEAGVTEPAGGDRDDCPAPEEGQRLFIHDTHGYCLLHPEEHTAEQVSEEETVFYQGSILNVQDPRLHVEMTDAAGQSALAVAEAIREEALAAVPDMDISLEETTVDGEPAAVVDGLPGQDINRRLVVVYDGRLYSLMFTPADAAHEGFEGMEALYALVTESMRFVAPEG